MKTHVESHNQLFEGLPDNITLRATSMFISAPSEYDLEEAYIDRAVDKRKSEFRTGRCVARCALKALHMPACAIPAGPNREPLWPAAVVGSISHCHGLCIAALATRKHYRSLGVDVEPNTRLPDDVLSMIFSEDERARDQAGLPDYWDVLTFSAKESVFKCVFPLIGFYFDFDEVSLLIDEKHQRFTATLPGRITRQSQITSVSGQYSVSKAFIFALAFIPEE